MYRSFPARGTLIAIQMLIRCPSNLTTSITRWQEENASLMTPSRSSYCSSHVFRRKVRVALCHTWGLVAQNLAHGIEVYALLNHP